MLNQYTTQGGVIVEYHSKALSYDGAIEPLTMQLNTHRGGIFASNFEFPGRYTCWDIGFINPPLVITSHDRRVVIDALNARGELMLGIIQSLSTSLDFVESCAYSGLSIEFMIKPSEDEFPEELRSQQRSVFSLLRHLIECFKLDDEHLGLYGSFGYDLVFQFEQIEKTQDRDPSQREMVVYFPDEIYIVDHRRELAFIKRYDFQYNGQSTQGLVREGKSQAYNPSEKPSMAGDHLPGEYAQTVRLAREKFKRGDLFEVVPGQTFYQTCEENPSAVFQRLRIANPAPYSFFINLGEEEYLVGASPEMYVRVTGDRVETCPISGTVRRGADAIEDAKNIQTLIESEKEASELTMCTDVDRNDKSRICQAGSVKVIGRRQIEMYSRVIHTVDHVEGYLREGFDAIDAFLSHMWVVTVTGAPKLWAMRFIEQHERNPRKWYAGAVGWFSFNGNLNTGLVLRTLRIKRGVAEIRAGATLLYDSIPEAEENETRLKASAFVDILSTKKAKQSNGKQYLYTGLGKRVLLIDHQDSFVHTLGNYFRQTGASVTTLRSGFDLDQIAQIAPDLVVLSPGPGCPQDFDLANTIQAVLAAGIPLFGVCLGLQAVAEFFGAKLLTLDYPVHGKESNIKVLGGCLLADCGETFTAGRYHSLYADKTSIPDELDVTAVNDEGLVMAIEHKSLPIYAVQFHPETILSMHQGLGLKIIAKVMTLLDN